MNSRLLSRTFQRQGPDYRQGQEVGFVDIRRRFDFRSIRIGRWVTPQEQSRVAGLFHDALLDLMLILNGTEALILLRGTLALQYGRRANAVWLGCLDWRCDTRAARFE